MSAIHIAVWNRSTVLTDAQVSAVVPALQTQVHRDWAPAWGSDADLTFVASHDTPPAGAWWLVILDDSDQATALGYHDLTPDGLPQGKVFAHSDIKFGYTWTVTASHELLEMLGDPDINLAAYVYTGTTLNRLYAYEVADACEADRYGYQIDGVLVSDFVFPSWFESFRKQGGTQFDFGGHITAPFELLPGGYIGVFDIRSGSGWHQLTAESTPLHYSMRARVGSRRERRRTPRDQWLLSEIS
ncbi:hypothetical protein [Nocardia tengchongensis]|uniref:hypothetical protein n=1 Tax=Nocardia tengchongensis TaxID=2055889 RepID=UPI003649C926